MKKEILIIVFITNLLSVYGQDFNKKLLLKKADSIVLSKTDKDFFNNVYRDSIVTEFNTIHIEPKSNIDTERIASDKKYRDSLSKKSFQIKYGFKSTNNFTFYLESKHGSSLSPNFFINFNEKGEAVNVPKFELYIEALNKLKNSNVIELKQAEITANKYFENKTRKTRENPRLVYNTDNKSLYWVVIRRKGGLRKYTETEVSIDAINNTFIKKENRKYYRGFWSGIGDFFGGTY